MSQTFRNRSTNTLRKSRFYILVLLLLVGFFSAGYLYLINNEKKASDELFASEDTSVLTAENKLGQVPLFFIPNKGQHSEDIDFSLNTKQGSLYFTGQETISVFSKKNVQEVVSSAGPKADAVDSERIIVSKKLLNSNANPQLIPQQELPGKINYFLGNDSNEWISDISTYSVMQYDEVYPGVDQVLRGTEENIFEYDFVVKPGADYSQIVMEYEGVDLELNDEGNLLLLKEGNELTREKKPYIYQVIDGNTVVIDGGFTIYEDTKVTFWIGDFDVNHDLIIDPEVLVYSSYLGGTGVEVGYAIETDSTGNIYVAGTTNSATFYTPGAYDTTLSGYDMFLSKLSPDGSTLLFSTFVGGSGLNDKPQKMAIDSGGNPVISGTTDSTDFPTLNAIQSSAGGVRDAFYIKVSSSGNSLIFSSYLGGSNADDGYSMALDSSDNIYITGITFSSANFPTANAYQGTFGGGGLDAFLTKILANGSSYSYSTFLGGTGNEIANGVVVNSSNEAIVVGFTASSSFPTVNPLQSYAGSDDGFISRFSSNGSALLYSTFFGGSGSDRLDGVQVDSSDNIIVTGVTGSTNYPTLNPIQGTHSNATYYDGTISKIAANGASILFSTYLGGSGSEELYGTSIDPSGNVYVLYQSNSTDFPTVNGLQAGYGGGANDAVISKIAANGSSLLFSSYLGGTSDEWPNDIYVDSVESIFVTGQTYSSDFPTVSPYKASIGAQDAFVAKINNPSLGIISSTPLQNGSTATTTSNIDIIFNKPLDTGTINQANLPVYGGGALLNGAYSTSTTTYTDDTVSFNPTNDLFIGSTINFIATPNIEPAPAVGGLPMSNGYVTNFNVQPTEGNGSFLTDVEYSGFTWPFYVHNGDLDNDGDVDLVVQDFSSFETLFNNGDGTFSIGDSFVASLGADQVMDIDDLNSDGLLDILVINGNTFFDVYYNTGSGNYDPAVQFSTGTTSYLDVGDVNGDGFIDVVKTGALKVRVLVNTGSGTFAPEVLYDVSAAPQNPELADLDNDGDLDVVVPMWNAVNDLAVLLNNGDGTYAAEVPYLGPTSQSAQQVEVKDINGDNFADIVMLSNVYGGAIDPVSVYLNSGNGSFPNRVDYWFPAGQVEHFYLADIYADGFLDVIAANRNTNQVHYLQNDGSGAFPTTITFTTGVGASQPYGLTAADFNNDGALDIATANGNTVTVSIHLAGIPPANLFANNTNAQSGDTNTSGITDGTPVFSAICNDLSPGADILDSYRLQVSTNSSFSSVLWDSGAGGTAMANCNSGSRSQDIEYGGAPLDQDGTKYYWRIRFWDDGGFLNEWSNTGDYFIMYDPTAAIIQAFAGNGTSGYSGDRGLAINANLSNPYDVAVDGFDNVFIADENNNVIRRVDAVTGIITTIAGVYGDGSYNPGDHGGPALGTTIGYPESITADAAGNVYFGDYFNDVIRKIDTNGIISLIAGTGSSGYSGDGGLAINADINNPLALALDSAGNLYFADYNNKLIRRVDAVSGIITTIAGIYNDSSFDLGDDGGPALNVAIGRPRSIDVDNQGNVYFGDVSNGLIRKIDSNGILTTLLGSGANSYGGDGGLAINAETDEPRTGLKVDVNGDIYFSETWDNRIRKIDAVTGIVDTVIGTGTAGLTGNNGSALLADINGTTGIVFNSNGELIFADKGNDVIRKVTFYEERIIPPVGTIIIQNDDLSTKDPLVDLTITAWDVNGYGMETSPLPGGIASYHLSNDGVNWTSDYTVTGPYVNGTPIIHNDWDLTDSNFGGDPSGGVKTVYLKVVDYDGNESSSVWMQTLQNDFDAGTLSQLTSSSNHFISLTQTGTPEIGSWSNGSPNIPNKLMSAAIAEVGGKIYLIGGFDNGLNTALDLVQIYDTASGSWSSGSTTPYIVRNASAVAVGTKIYVFGGDVGKNNETDGMMIYDTVGDSWSLGTNAGASFARQSYAAGENNGIIYYIGGMNNNLGSMFSDVISYNISLNTWTTAGLASIPSGTRNRLAFGQIGNKVYIAKSDSSPNEAYDMSADSWATLTSPSIARSLASSPCGAVLNGLFYMIGNWTGGNMVEMYNPETDTWTAVASLNQNRHRCASIGVGNSVYAFGGVPEGDGGGTVVNTWEKAISSLAYQTSGTFTSSIFNARNQTSFLQIAWSETVPANTDLTIDYRGCNQSNCSDGIWQTGLTSTPEAISIVDSQYFQYRANLSTTDGAVTPVLSQVGVTYDGTITDIIELGGNGSAIRLRRELEDELLRQKEKDSAEVAPDNEEIGDDIKEEVYMNVEDMDLVKVNGNDAVYFVDEFGKRHVFPNQDIYSSWYPDFSEVDTISQEKLSSLETDSPIFMRPGTWLVKITSDPKVYAVEPGGNLRWIPNEETAVTLYGENWNLIIKDLPDAFFTFYSVGDPLSMAPLSYGDGTILSVVGGPNIVFIQGAGYLGLSDDDLTKGRFQTKFFLETDSLVGLNLENKGPFPEFTFEQLIVG